MTRNALLPPDVPRFGTGAFEGEFKPFTPADLEGIARTISRRMHGDVVAACNALNRGADDFVFWRMADGAPPRERASWLAGIADAADAFQAALGVDRSDTVGSLSWDARQQLRTGRDVADPWLRRLVGAVRRDDSPLPDGLRMDAALDAAIAGVALIRYLAVGAERHWSERAKRGGRRKMEGRQALIYWFAVAFARAYRTRPVANKDGTRDGISLFSDFAAEAARITADRLAAQSVPRDPRAAHDLQSITASTAPTLLYEMRAARRERRTIREPPLSAEGV